MPRAQTPAPGILAVHGYINSRETQDGFAIEFARRGYVVLALDQTGHGYSDPPAFANGFGGPDGLAYLRSLEYRRQEQYRARGPLDGRLDRARRRHRDAERLQVDGAGGLLDRQAVRRRGHRRAGRATSRWCSPNTRNSPTLMWGVDRARDVTQSPKLWALFGTQGAVEPGKVYGDIAQGTARVLYTPAITHPAEHISHEAIGYSLDWFAKTLQGGTPRPADDQIWFRKEIGTLIALVGFVALLIGVFDGLLEAPMFSRLQAARDRRRHHAAARRRQRPALDHGVHPVRLHSGADLLSGLRARPAPSSRRRRSCPRASPTRSWSGPSSTALIALALMPFAPETRQPGRHHRAVDPDRGRHRRRRLCRAVAGRSRLQDRFPVLDRRAQADERQAVPDLPDLSGAVHGVFRDRAARAAPEFLDHGAPRAARSTSPISWR